MKPPFKKDIKATKGKKTGFWWLSLTYNGEKYKATFRNYTLKDAKTIFISQLKFQLRLLAEQQN